MPLLLICQIVKDQCSGRVLRTHRHLPTRAVAYLPKIRGKQATDLTPRAQRKPQLRHVEGTEYSRTPIPVKGPKRFERKKFRPQLFLYATNGYSVCALLERGPVTGVRLTKLPPREIQTTQKPLKTSGDDRTRTDDPRVANAMLSQLSYVPPRGRAIRSHRPHVIFISGRT